MSDDSDAAIRALLFDDESLARLDVFVVGLGESIDAIQDAEHLGHFEEVAKRCGDLAREAATLGLPALAVAAERVVAICRSGPVTETRNGIVALTDVVRRVRLGHRGAA